MDQSRRRTESEAFNTLVDEITQTWRGVVNRYTLPRVKAPSDRGPANDRRHPAIGASICRDGERYETALPER